MIQVHKIDVKVARIYEKDCPQIFNPDSKLRMNFIQKLKIMQTRENRAKNMSQKFELLRS